ncbi:hypothetical protein [Streptomyces sp. NPDC055058]
MAFGAEELRVLRRALALALHPAAASADDVQDCLRLADAVDEATRESARLRAFLVADLGRYRAALPGTAAGYLTLLEEALGAGHRPGPDDLAALRALRGNPVAAALLERCQVLAEQDVRARLAGRSTRVGASARATVPASRTRLMALPGGQAVSERTEKDRSEKSPGQNPSPRPKPAPAPAAPKPSRPIPTPGEVFPRRKPAPPPADQRLAAG